MQRFKDTLKASLKCFDVDPKNWELQVLGVQPLPTVLLPMRQSAPFKQKQKDRKERLESLMPTQQLLNPHLVLPT